MADFSPTPRRFVYRGIQLVPQDALQEGKVPYCLNIRSYQEQTITVRDGTVAISTPALGAAIHSLFRLNDTTPYATLGAAARRFVGATDTLYAGTPGSPPFTPVVTGLSGNPLTAVAAAPKDSPRPWLYVADSARLRKVNSDLNDQPLGIPAPITPPTALFAQIQQTLGEPESSSAWVAYGPVTSAAAITPRLNTTVTTVLYDDGTSGMASIALADMVGLVVGTTVQLDGVPVIAQEVHPAVGTTTVAAIQYDAGTTGLCTIQPAGSLYTGQIETVIPNEVRRRYEALGQPVPSRVTVTRVVDYAVNSIVQIGGAENVRIQSVALGPDGTLSFRAFANGTFGPGASIIGVSAFRGYTLSTISPGDPATADQQDVVVTPTSDDPVVGGIQCPTLVTWDRVGSQATSQDDIIRFGFRAQQFGFVESVRLMINVSDDDGFGGASFLRNYYLYEWRASDLLAAIQIVIGDATALMSETQQFAVTQGQTDAAYGDQYAQEASRGPDDLGGAPGNPTREARDSSQPTDRVAVPRVPGRARTDSFVPVGAAPSRQLAIGDDQWVWLQCRVGDLTRIGTDATKTFATINAFALIAQVSGTTAPQTLSFGDLYLTGGYGPDAGQTLPPYVYRYRYRSTINGERSNPSPPMRGGLAPQRGRLALTGSQSSAPQCDVVDWFRYGGSLARWSYVGTSLNTATPAFNDDMQDGQIDGGETLDTEQYDLWPVFDLPRQGTCNVAGTAVTWVSGSQFNTNWSAGSTIIINGRATALYRQPSTPTFLEVVDNCGAGSAVSFTLPGAIILTQPLPYMWGGPINDVWFNFACGDPSDGALLHWTHGNDPDATSPANTVVGTSASEPLVNGYFDDGVPYVFSTDNLYRIVPTFGNISTFEIIETKCTKGLWAPWAFCVIPFGGGVVFLAKDGIYLSQGGGAAESLIDPDLRALFPQDGTEPQWIRNLYPVDMTQTDRLRLSVVDNFIYFDYVDTNGDNRTFVFEPLYKRWTPDVYNVGATLRLSEPGPQVHDHLIGGVDGILYQFTAEQLTDDGANIPWAVDTEWANGDSLREQKQWGDAVLDMNPAGAFNGIVVTPVVQYGNVALAPSTLGAGDTLRRTYIVEANPGPAAIDAGIGVLSQVFGLQIRGLVDLCDFQRPLLYFWDGSFLRKGMSIARRATDYEDLGYVGAKFIQGIVLRANTRDLPKQIAVEFDGGQTALTLTAQHNGDVTLAYPLASAGWTPFLAETVRLHGVDDLPWELLDWRWVFEPAPELATQWETQETTFDLPGYLSVHDAVMAYVSTTPIALRVWHADDFADYVLPASGGTYTRNYTLFTTAKGLNAKFRLTAPAPFRLFKRDCSVRIQGWGAPGSYAVQNPFGGPSRADGAAI